MWGGGRDGGSEDGDIGEGGGVDGSWKGRCKATWKREFRLPWRKAGLLNPLDVQVHGVHEPR